MDLQLNDAVVLVTGAGNGIGLAITQAFVREGAQVVAGSLSATDGLRELAASGKVQIVEVDLSTPDGPARLVDAAGPRVGNITGAEVVIDGGMVTTV